MTESMFVGARPELQASRGDSITLTEIEFIVKFARWLLTNSDAWFCIR